MVDDVGDVYKTVGIRGFDDLREEKFMGGIRESASKDLDAGAR
jgi:hypothetical protein